MEKKSFSPKLAGGLGCIAGILCTILVAAIAICVFIVRWGNRQDWLPDYAENAEFENVDSVEVAQEDEVFFLGSYEQVNEDGGDVQLRVEAWGSEISVTLASFDQQRLYAIGEIDPEKTRRSERGGVQLKTTLKQYDNDYNVTFTDDVTITLDQRPDSLYDLSVSFDGEPSQSAIQVLKEPRRMFLVFPDEHEMTNALPFKINKEKPTMAGMLRELYRYVFMYELYSTAKHIRRGFDKTELAEYEQITIDERNRFFSYSWGEYNLCLEGKYFWLKEDGTADGFGGGNDLKGKDAGGSNAVGNGVEGNGAEGKGVKCKGVEGKGVKGKGVKGSKILIVLDQHEATYDGGQRLRFFVIDPERQLISERLRHLMIPAEWIERGDAIFQVRYATEGLVAVFNDGNGGLDTKTLKFNGMQFTE